MKEYDSRGDRAPRLQEMKKYDSGAVVDPLSRSVVFEADAATERRGYSK
jgi:hypothetical protein